MSREVVLKRRTVRDMMIQKQNQQPIVVLTAYTTPVARRLDPFVDVLLVGDSLGMALYGLETTLGVTLEMMIAHGAAVVRGSQQALVVVDMPFGSYHESPAQAFRNAARVLVETGAGAVKLEGGVEMAETIRFLVERGIPVMAHVGLKPQSVHAMGGFRAQGRTADEAKQVRADAHAVAEAGAFSMVLEGTYEAVARQIAEDSPIPVIGIGASPACDGQVLVIDDVLGTFDGTSPKFAKRYADLGTEIGRAAEAYATEVRNRTFPAPEHCFGITQK